MMKTYGRSSWRVYDDQRPAAKKRRVLSDCESDAAEKSLEYAIRESTANMRSSPSRRNSLALSDGSHDTDLSTPPSSPPPRLSPPPQNTRKPTFSFLKRKHTATKDGVNGSPLSEVNSNSVRASLDPPKKTATLATKPPALKQMQLDLGHDVRKTCATCGMEYVPSNAEDASLHKKFHDMNSTGVDLGKAFMRQNASRWVYEATRFDEGYVVIIDRKSTPTAKNQAKKVLEVLSKELSSPVIEDEILWSQTEPPKHLRKNGESEKMDRYKVFLHMKDSRCVGACLTERIWQSHAVDKAAAQADDTDSAVTVCDEAHPAIVGISRIWTSGSSRRKGIAMDLLDCVVSNFIYGMEIPKEQVAFSQPTNSGKSLAQAFFGPENEWHVYKENSTARQRQSHPPPPISSPPTALDQIFLSHSPSSAVATNQAKVRSPSAGVSSPPSASPNAPDLDGSSTLDGQSASDPFIQSSDVSDDEAEQAQVPPGSPTTVLGDRTIPPSGSSSQPSTTSHSTERQTPTRPQVDTVIASSFASSQSAPLEAPEITTSGRPISLGPGLDPSALAIRSGNRERVPPPPPKTHHGRLISPDLNNTSPASVVPGKAISRVSFHESPPKFTISPRVLQSDSDCFDSSFSHQSQHKRPPTPPLSRRHSHVRRSKSTLSKPNSSHISTPPSPGSRSLTPSLRSRDSRNDSSIPDESRLTLTLSSENIEPRSSLQPMGVLGLRTQSNSRILSKQASSTSHLPPPPPPRRTRGRNQSSDDSRNSSLRSEQRVGGPENYVPRPSNAQDILADLSRLQKEVDDLRGHYESRKAW
ncbi:uncharacterized protein BDV17DRAFT_280809 [Aspergillus undulatus]|uniref:uncharacterized protein n=1 Tax=Aspergillus undulatus TaxID=1810928 RepID=UPI003CCE476C